MSNPYQVEKRNSYYVVVDSRNGQLASYPTGSKKECLSFADTMNRAYAEAVGEL